MRLMGGTPVGLESEGLADVGGSIAYEWERVGCPLPCGDGSRYGIAFGDCAAVLYPTTRG